MPLNINRKKILILEDDDFLREMYKSKLKLENFQVEAVANGEQGLRKIEKFFPDLILLDILMPKIDGFEFLEKMRAQKKYQKIPVILLTNLWSKEAVDKGFKLGAIDYLIKAHFIPSEVIQKIKKYI